jgi:hypothetical protein
MTRKDYVLLSSAIKKQWDIEVSLHGRGDNSLTVHNTAARIAYALQRDNPRFDKNRFLTDCGIK